MGFLCFSAFFCLYAVFFLYQDTTENTLNLVSLVPKFDMGIFNMIYYIINKRVKVDGMVWIMLFC